MPVRKEILQRFNWREEDERGDFAVGSGPSTEFEIDDKERGRADIKDLEWYYWNYGPAFRGLNLKAASFWGRGFKIVGDDNKLKEMCEKITLKMSGFKQWFIIGCLHAVAFGKGPEEIIWDDENKLDEKGKIIKDKNGFIVKREEGKNILGYTETDYKTFKPKWDAQGYITHWVQKVISKTGIEDKTSHKPRKICYFKFHQIADNVEGIGLMETNLSTIKALKNSEKSSDTLLFRHGSPFVHVKKDGATSVDIQKLTKIGKNFNRSNHLASSEKINIELIGIKGKSVDIKPHIDQFQDNLSGGFGIPKAVLFAAGNEVNRATLTELLTMTSAEIKTYQEKCSDIIENQIFIPYLKANGKDITEVPQVVWEPLDEKSETQILENFKLLSEGMAKLKQAEVYTADEVKTVINHKFGETLGLEKDEG